MSKSFRDSMLVLGVLAAFCPHRSEAEERPLPRITATGETAGGTKDVFYTLDGSPVINDGGDVAFRGGVAPANSGPAPSLRRGIWKGNAATGLVEVLAIDGEPVPGGEGLVFKGFSLPTILSDGKVLFLSSTDGDLAFDALFSASRHDDVKRVLASSEIDSTRIDGFLVSDVELTVVLSEKGLYAGGSGTFDPLAVLGAAAPGAGGATNAILSMPSYNLGGLAAYLAFLGGAPPDADTGVWLGGGSEATLLYREGAAAPARAANGNQLFYGSFSTEASINNPGRVAFLSPLTGGILETSGIFHGTNAADLSPVAIRGTLASSDVGDVSFTSLFSPVMASDGAVYFTAVASVRPPDPRPVPLRTVPSLWRADGAGLHLVAGMAGAAPGTSELLGRITSYAVNFNNRVAFTAEIYDPVGAKSNGFGLWAQDSSGALGLKVRTGDTVPISALETRTVASNADSILLLNPFRSLTDAARRGPSDGVPTGYADGDQPVFRLQFTGDGAFGSFGLFGASLVPAPPIVVQPVVNSVDDDADRTPGDEICDTGGTVDGQPECTLRAALMECNASEGLNRISFAIDGPGTPTIFARSALPPLSKALVIDATTQEGGRVSIHGGSAGGGVDGLRVQAEGCELKGLTITAFKGHGLSSEALSVKLGSPDFSANGGDGISAPAGGVTVEGVLKLIGNTGHGLNALKDVLLDNTHTVHEASTNGQNGILTEGKVQLVFGALSVVGNGRLRTGEQCAEDRAAGVAAGEIDIEVLEARSTCGSGMVADREIYLSRVILEDNSRYGARSFLGGITLTGAEQFVSRNKLDGLECSNGTADVASSVVVGQNGGYGILAKDIKLSGEYAWIEENGKGGLQAFQTIASAIPITVSQNGKLLPSFQCEDARVGGVVADGDVTLSDIIAVGNCGSAIYSDNGSVRTKNATLTHNSQYAIRCPSQDVVLQGFEHTISQNGRGGLLLNLGAVRITGKATLHDNGAGRGTECRIEKVAAIITDGPVEVEDIDLRRNCGSGIRCGSLRAESVICTDHTQYGIQVLGNEEVVLNGAEHQIARNGFDGIAAQHASVTLLGEAFIIGNGQNLDPGQCSLDPPGHGGIASGVIIQGQTVDSSLNCGVGLTASQGIHIDRLKAERNTQHGVYSHDFGVLLSSSGHVLSRNGGDGLAAPAGRVEIHGTMEANANGRNGLTVAEVSLFGDGTICDNAMVGIDLAGGGTAQLGDVQVSCNNGLGPVRTGRGTIVSPRGPGMEVGEVDNPSPGDAPAGQDFPAGFYEVSAGGGAEGGGAGGVVDAPLTVDVLLKLPAGFQAETYYNYGPTPGQPAPHWYEFLFDGTTGAEITPGQVLLRLVDGLRGDDDLAENGSIHSLGGPAIAVGDVLPQLPGDCNQDGLFNISDPICILGFLFLGSPAQLPCGDGSGDHAGNRALLDWQSDGRINLTDAVSALGFLFLGGPPHALVRDPAGQLCVPIAGCRADPACR